MAYELLAVRNIQAVVDALQDARQTTRQYTWLDRVRPVPAEDGEVMARYSGRAMAADILQLDGVAVVRASNPVTTERTGIPKLKHGAAIPESKLALLNRIEAGLASARDRGFFEDFVVNTAIDLRDGVSARMEAIICAMLEDTFSYNRMGIIISGLGWGMPSDLKVTSSPVWSGATGTPITDILTTKSLAEQKYGVTYDRITMSTQALLHAVATTQFKEQAQLSFFGQAIPASGLPVQNTQMMRTMLGNLVGMMVEIDDRQYWTESIAGAQTANRFITATKVILSATAFDGDTGVWDFANAVVLETMPGLVSALIGEFDGEREGPVAYATAATPDGNPPGMNLWGVGRGWARKHQLAANAVITAY